MSAERRHRVNEDVSVTEVRLIDAEGHNVGVVPIAEAQRVAQEADLDLVEIVPNAEPPVCRVMDYGKFKFEESKKAQLARKKQRTIHVKEVKFRPGTDVGDYQIKVRNLIRFLNDGDKAKVTIRFRGREFAHKERGAQLLERIEAELTEYGDVEQRPRLEGRQMVMVLAPKKKK